MNYPREQYAEYQRERRARLREQKRCTACKRPSKGYLCPQCREVANAWRRGRKR